MDAHALWVVKGLAGLLGTATLLAALVAWRASTDAGRATAENLMARIKAWWWMAAVFVAIILTGPTAAVWLFALMSFLALREFITLTPTKVDDYFTLCLVFFVVLPLNFLLVSINWYGTWVVLIPAFTFLLIPLTTLSSGKMGGFLARVAKIQWAVMVCIYFVSHVPALLMLRIGEAEPGDWRLVFFLVFVVQMSDILQYVFGKLLGRRKIAPEVSPKKTWEGFIGGVLSASLLGAGIHFLTPFSATQAFGLALVICLMGFFGGLTLSAVKRDLGVKDWGTMLEGHGGMLDRIDSLCFAAPVFFHIVRYYFSDW